MPDLDNKPLYVASYIKQLALESTGAKRVDQSVYSAVQDAIKSALSGVSLEGDRAVHKGGSAPEPEEEEQPKKPKAKPAPSVSGGLARGDRCVLVKVANGEVFETHSDMLVHVVDFDRLGRILGNPAYDSEVRDEIAVLRSIARSVKTFDCERLADEFEAIHERRRK